MALPAGRTNLRFGVTMLKLALVLSISTSWFSPVLASFIRFKPDTEYVYTFHSSTELKMVRTLQAESKVSRPFNLMAIVEPQYGATDVGLSSSQRHIRGKDESPDSVDVSCFGTRGYSNPSAWTVQLGKLYASSNIDASNGEYESGVSQVIIQEGYNQVTSDNDIAVMVLSNPLPASNSFVNFACLDLNRTRTFDSTSNCFTSGFGALSSGGSLATVLQEANVPLIPRTTCNGPYNYDGEVTTNMLCAGYVEGGIDSCQGDSGGPLVCASKDNAADVERWYLVGVTSWGYGCAQANYPGVYTDVSQYIDWLQTKMA
ncbi:trypsin-1-like [Patiria miniata]|uniref:Peptidase S1 domain-containing protein n=1 Tax=Patiria miniata TaxID=46514 RepID=A0A914AFU3_PATMI|nr:trypsin-1-like [Patiria miniata]